jgi:Xaa-Pro aminopeptidase
LLTPEEKEWVDSYHKEVWEKTGGFFEKDERTTKWLKRETREI